MSYPYAAAHRHYTAAHGRTKWQVRYTLPSVLYTSDLSTYPHYKKKKKFWFNRKFYTFTLLTNLIHQI